MGWYVCGVLIKPSATYLALSVSAQNKGGIVVHQIWSVVDTTSPTYSSNVVFLGSTFGRKFIKFHLSSLPACIRQNPSFMSSFEKNGVEFVGATAMSTNKRCRTLPSLFMEYCGTVYLVAPFTDGILMPLTISPNNRSTISLNFLQLCGIVAMWEIFS